MNIVVLDNFDSFTFNLVDEFSSPQHKIHVWRNSMQIDEAERRLLHLPSPKLLVLSPGPGHPDDAGCMNELIRRMQAKMPIFGVCLGMQAMVSIFGGKVTRAPRAVHGKARILVHQQEYIFKGLEPRLHIGRYHSLSASVVPENFAIFGHSDDLVMAIAHKTHPLMGIQFHPESILTTQGSMMIRNVIAWAKERA